MGCVSDKDLAPQATTSPRGGGATLELSVSETKQFALPAGMNEMKVPPMLAEYLTDPAWMAICGEMKEQQWQRNTAAQIGAAFSQRLNTAYAPLTFGCRMDQSSEWNHYHNYPEMHYFFKLSISTESTMTVAVPAEVGPGQQFTFTRPQTQQQFMAVAPADGSKATTVTISAPPATRMTARSVVVQLPANANQGGTFEIEHPETGVRMTITPPTPMAVGSVFRCDC